MQKVAFICVHNSCRSQIAEALRRHLAAAAEVSFFGFLHKQYEVSIAI